MKKCIVGRKGLLKQIKGLEGKMQDIKDELKVQKEQSILKSLFAYVEPAVAQKTAIELEEKQNFISEQKNTSQAFRKQATKRLGGFSASQKKLEKKKDSPFLMVTVPEVEEERESKHEKGNTFKLPSFIDDVSNAPSHQELYPSSDENESKMPKRQGSDVTIISQMPVGRKERSVDLKSKFCLSL